MTHRHVPTVFSIYMLDVICCALGCVILLWQASHYEAEEQSEAARQSGSEVDTLRHLLAESRKEEQRLSAEKLHVEAERDDAHRRLALRRGEYEQLQQAYLFSEAMLKNLRVERDKLEKDKKLAAVDLAEKVNANAQLLLRLTAMEKKATALANDVAARKLDAEEAAKLLAEQLARLQTAELANKKLDKQLADLRATQKDTQAKLTTQELQSKILAQDLERNKKELAATSGDAAARIAELRKDRTLLNERVRTIQAEAEARFAGIALTGENVLFLVDMSGSMAMRDEKTADPDKWPLVCETVVQLMRSIKTLEFFQVLLFSEKVRYPLGNSAAWIKYDPKESPKKTLAALKAVEPEGETNMHAVFAEAFRYREARLDTLYVFSDGLPNAGNGVSANLSEAERTSILSKHLRNKLKTDWNRPIEGQKKVRINSIGFFFESPDVGAFLWALSREHDGSFVGMSK
jgi:DNA gyrase/topoisomerase IV subunit A